MKDEKYTPEVGSWLKGREVPHPDSQQTARQVAARLPHISQRSRWWPLPSSRRPPTTDPTTAYQPSPIPASNSHTPSVIGRTTSMLSPVKAITAGAIVFAIGGTFLIAQPFDQQGSVAPGAEAQAFPTPVRFSSTYRWRGESTPGTRETRDDGVQVTAGEGFAFTSAEATDPRFAGPMAMTLNRVHHPDEGDITLGGYRIETEDGAWQEVPTAALQFEEDTADWRAGRMPPADNIQFRTFIGEGDYAGLIAVAQATWWPDGGSREEIQLDGWVIEGDLPDAPEPWMPS